MKQSKKEWARSLALYGSDFRRWPEEPDKDQQAAIQASDEYLEACRSDAALDGTAWPAPSEALYGRTLEKIRQQDDFATPAMPVLIFIRRPALFFSVILMALCLGFTSGTQYNSTVSEGQEYSYFSIGPAYTYSTVTGW